MVVTTRCCAPDRRTRIRPPSPQAALISSEAASETVVANWSIFGGQARRDFQLALKAPLGKGLPDVRLRWWTRLDASLNTQTFSSSTGRPGAGNGLGDAENAVLRLGSGQSQSVTDTFVPLKRFTRPPRRTALNTRQGFRMNRGETYRGGKLAEWTDPGLVGPW